MGDVKQSFIKNTGTHHMNLTRVSRRILPFSLMSSVWVPMQCLEVLFNWSAVLLSRSFWPVPWLWTGLLCTPLVRPTPAGSTHRANRNSACEISDGISTQIFIWSKTYNTNCKKALLQVKVLALKWIQMRYQKLLCRMAYFKIMFHYIYDFIYFLL